MHKSHRIANRGKGEMGKTQVKSKKLKVKSERNRKTVDIIQWTGGKKERFFHS